MKKILIILITILILLGCTPQNTPETVEQIEPETKEQVTVDFLAVGDNLIHGAIYAEPTFVANGYDYTPIYSEIKPAVQAADIAYLNQETILGGRELELSNYPMFNSPTEIGDAIADTGFNWINHATNHTLDRGEQGIINTLDFWDTYPDITVSGIARNQNEADQTQIIEKDGVRFGLLAYTYGTNGIPVPEGKEYLVNLIDKDKIAADVNTLKGITDSIIVSMHWGTEYSFVQDELQTELAQFMSDLGVDVIIGSHPHVIQPMEWVTGKDGNKTLVIYSLGNFLSAQDVNYRMLGGLASWSMTFDPNDESIEINNVLFEPTITYFEPNYRNFKIFYLKDYTNELAAQHGLASSYDMSREYFTSLVDDVMNDTFEIRY